ncbi:MAG: DUF4124 domain-containing protein [Gammaproteobacteria bacterium]|jgi:hypothetical protein|nr:DUF4124 domain-containing protein [Gammaproteobacteria bacterium]
MGRDRDETAFVFGPEGPVAKRPRRWPWVVLLLLALAASGVGAWLYLQRNEAPKWLKGSGLAPKPAPTVVYKWRDAQGAWHVTDAPPPEGTSFERLEYAHDQNVLPLPPQLQRKQ